MIHQKIGAMTLALFALSICEVQHAAELDHGRKVALVRVPDAGIQPQVAVDTAGVVHMIYYKGDPGEGDLYYVRSRDGGATFSAPLAVNSGRGSAVAAGNIRGGHLAVGKNGRVHVAWNGSHQDDPAGPRGHEPMLYTRLNDAGTAFEPQRNLIRSAYGLDGGGALAADGAGNVYVFWHAPEPGKEGEGNRRVWVARSRDDGKTFEPERPAYDKPTGACGCCGLNAFADRKGTVYVLYRSATETVHRDIYLLVSSDKGQTFQGEDISKWNIGACVMSSASFAESPAGVLGAWETEKQAYFGRIDRASGKIALPVAAPGAGQNRKFPAVAGNSQGETMFAWTEGMGWKKGGELEWQVYDKTGKPTAERGKINGVPVWSLIAVFARPDGGFTVMY
jgi:hypothetical protein